MIRIIGALLSGLAVMLGLIAALWFAPEPLVRLPLSVDNHLSQSGVAHPTTAVLLNFRSYDTLLEVAVLLVAVVITLSLAQPGTNQQQEADDPMALALTRRLIPLMLMMGFYLLWAGAYQPGGAFQAGALIASAGVIARLAGIPLTTKANLVLRTGLSMGLSVFLLVATAPLVAGTPFLTYPPQWASVLILIIEAVLTFSIALTLLSLFLFAPEHAGAKDGD